ncbi:hypothetical protein DYY67_0668 [Candidatus Nitrosotalea sp. TS]|nr:hypothetical protein [Candidatus Nitrosotalea sp. TS]
MVAMPKKKLFAFAIMMGIACVIIGSIVIAINLVHFL